MPTWVSDAPTSTRCASNRRRHGEGRACASPRPSSMTADDDGLGATSASARRWTVDRRSRMAPRGAAVQRSGGRNARRSRGGRADGQAELVAGAELPFQRTEHAKPTRFGSCPSSPGEMQKWRDFQPLRRFHEQRPGSAKRSRGHRPTTAPPPLRRRGPRRLDQQRHRTGLPPRYRKRVRARPREQRIRDARREIRSLRSPAEGGRWPPPRSPSWDRIAMCVLLGPVPSSRCVGPLYPFGPSLVPQPGERQRLRRALWAPTFFTYPGTVPGLGLGRWGGAVIWNWSRPSKSNWAG